MNARLIGELVADPTVRGVQRLREARGPERFAKDLSRSTSIHGLTTLTILKQRRGQRALIRIDVDDGNHRMRWYAKLLRRSREGGTERCALLRHVSECAASVGVQVPAPVTYLPRFKALVFESAGGQSLLPCCAPADSRLVAADIGAVDRPALFRALGEAVSTLHNSLPRTDTHKTRDFESRQIGRARSRLVENRPDLIVPFDESVRLWSQKRPQELSNEPPVLAAVHGDLYPAQVLFSIDSGSERPHFAILDWDALCDGEGERDVGNFQAHLFLEGIRGHLKLGEVMTLSNTFEEGYRNNREAWPRLLAWYRRGALLRLAALYSDPSFGPHPPNPLALPESLLQSAQ